jgi:2-dehydropantoate 2-reductase
MWWGSGRVSAVRFIVYGAGAIGGVVGGRLFEHGHEVVLIARGDHARVIAADGLRIVSADDSVVLETPVVEHPSALEARADDIVLLSMKSQDTRGALDALVATWPRSTPIVCVQNGVENERAALRRFAHVYGACVMCPAGHLEPGVVQAHSTPISGLLDVGRYPHGTGEVAEQVVAALSSSTFDSHTEPEIMRWKYGKLLTNLGNAIEVVCGRPARGGPIGKLVRAEGRAVLDAAGIDAISDDEDRNRRGDLLTRKPIDGRARSGASSWQSLARRTVSIESDFLNGEIVLLGRRHRVPTPVNELLQQLAVDLAVRRRPPAEMTEDDFLALLPG